MSVNDNSLSYCRSIQDHGDYPVHLTSDIQPHGVLLALDLETLSILRASSNSDDYLNIPSQQLLQQPLSTAIAPDSVIALQTCFEKDPNSLHYQRVQGAYSDHLFDGFVHCTSEQMILELEPADLRPSDHFIHLQNTVGQMIRRLRAIRDRDEFLHCTAMEMQQLTGYDRVMIYQFDDQNAGSVVAEATASDDIAYLGFHFPATDIPTLVRRLYRQGMVRYVPDLTAVAAQLMATDHVLTRSPLDLSGAMLRGVDPCCIAYHQNMGVSAFFVVALVGEERLWGLMAFHHKTPKTLSYSLRSACEGLGQFVASELASKVHANEVVYLNTLKTIQSDFLSSITTAQNFKQALIHPEPHLLELVGAYGAAVCLDHDITLIGQTPPLEAVEGMINWAMNDLDSHIFHTACFSQHYSAGLEIKAVASGLLALKISQLRRYLILWFRPEVLQTISWAGNPHEAVRQNDEGHVVIGPRTSFAQWQETVEATALPWKPAEIENALALKSSIVGIVLNKADELAKMNVELERKNRELESFAYAASHDLKEPLRGINNFTNIIMKRHGDQLDEKGISRLQTLIRLAQRMDALIDALLKFSRLGQAELNYQMTDIHTLVHHVIDGVVARYEETGINPQFQVPKPLPNLNCDPVLMSDVFSNLIGNSIKYAQTTNPVIEIGYLVSEEQKGNGEDEHRVQEAYFQSTKGTTFYVKDDGIGIHERHFQTVFRLFKRLHDRDSYGGGTGVGLTIAKKIIERHGGQIWIESSQGQGSTFYFMLSCADN